MVADPGEFFDGEDEGGRNHAEVFYKSVTHRQIEIVG
jgi:hypothetical protein